MSAAEKLRAEVEWRDEGWDSGPYDNHSNSVGYWLYEARAEITALVEAAEAIPELGEDNYVLSDLREALGSLDKALS